MKKLEIAYLCYENPEVMELSDRLLVEESRRILENAYAPYSCFKVGAAVLLDNGKIISANNQENVAYPSGLCAERVALFYASSQFPDNKPVALAIMARSPHFSPLKAVTPCGACRQVMSEYEKKAGVPLKVIMASEKGEVYLVNSSFNLLPFHFDANLKSL